MLEAFELITKQSPNAKLVIAGGNHPNAAGYVESVKLKCAGLDRIEFTGYVPEESLPELFQSSSVTVMPYSSSTGSSGVAHLACAYGVPIVCADLADFRQMAAEEDLAVDFYRPGSARDLAKSTGDPKLRSGGAHDDAGHRAEVFAAFRVTPTNRSLAIRDFIPKTTELGASEILPVTSHDAKFYKLDAAIGASAGGLESPR
jgi:hypothetical protein